MAVVLFFTSKLEFSPSDSASGCRLGKSNKNVNVISAQTRRGSENSDKGMNVYKPFSSFSLCVQSLIF